MSTPISFSDACLKEKNFSLLNLTQKTSWNGKKVYLSYNNTTGWQIHQLGFLDRLLRFFRIYFRETQSKHIYRNLDKLNEKDIELISKNPKLRLSIQKIIQTNKKFFGPFNKTFSCHLKSINHEPIAPLKLVNYQSSRCYMDCILEILLNEKSIREIIFKEHAFLSEKLGIDSQGKKKQEKREDPQPLSKKDLETNEEDSDSDSDIDEDFLQPEDLAQIIDEKSDEYKRLKLKYEILDALIALILDADIKGADKKGAEVEGKNSLGEKVREAIFNHNYTLKEGEFNYSKFSKEIYYTFDAMNVYEFLTTEILGLRHSQQSAFLTKITDKGIPNPPEPTLTHFSNNKIILPIKNTLKEGISSVLGKALPGDKERSFIIDGKAQNNVEHTTREFLTSLPEIVALQLGRFEVDFSTGKAVSKKINSPVSLPEDGIIDLDPYYIGPKEKSSRYEITGYAIHRGTFQRGHYIAYVKTGNSFYECDNRGIKSALEISKERFYNNKDAYFIILKKLD